MIGREAQTNELQSALKSRKSAFIAITGRRRVGKTYLIDEVFKKNICLRVTGIQNGDTQTQQINFLQKIASHASTPFVSTPKNWQEIFLHLKTYLKTCSPRKKHVIFLDELPWICTPKSGFIQLLAHLWNDYLSKESYFILVVCGSSTS
ncbi:MAG: AAA family ATPase, partial [Leadbetterella sp.]